LNLERIIAGQKENLKKAQNEISLILQNKKWNYLEMRDAMSLSPDLSNSKQITILGVYQLGTTRLLDNIQVKIS
jgi:pantothenate synthetase